MHRRQALTLVVGFVAGCSSQSSEPTSTPPTESTPSATDTPADETATPTPTSTETPTETSTAVPEASLDTVAAELNEVYTSLEPALETMEVAALDIAGLTSQLETLRTTLSAVDSADSAAEERRQSLSDTRWIFDRLTRAFGRVRDIYEVHPTLHDVYRASERTDQTTSQVETVQRLATEASSSVGTAVARYDSMRSFDDALAVGYDDFGDQIFPVSDAIKDLTPFILGLRASMSARERYVDAVALYEEGSYADARSEFADLLSSFTDAFQQFNETTAIFGPLEPYANFYRCQSGQARLACVDYRSACREQRDDNPDDADELQADAEVHYNTCEPVEGPIESGSESG